MTKPRGHTPACRIPISDLFRNVSSAVCFLHASHLRVSPLTEISGEIDGVSGLPTKTSTNTEDDEE